MDANGKRLPDGEKTKLLPSGEDGVALQVTLEDEGPESTRVDKERHELRMCCLDTSMLRNKTGATGEQMVALIALFATFDLVVMTNAPPGEGLHAASALKNVLAHHSGDAWEFVILKDTTIFLRQPLSVLASINTLVFHDSRFKHQPKVKSIRVQAGRVHLSDSDSDDIADIDDMAVVDGWLEVSSSRKIESQTVPLDLQVVELGESGESGESGETGKAETAEEAETGGEHGAAIYCVKLLD